MAYWYPEHNSEVPFKFPAMVREPISHFVTQLPTMIPINSKLNPVTFWHAMQNLEYKSQNKIEQPMDTIYSSFCQHFLHFSLQLFVFGIF
jgi:hypothetical protein